MTHQTLKQLSDIIQASEEPIAVDLQPDRLTINTAKNTFWVFLSVIGIAFSVLLVATNRRGQYNLEIGLVLLWISIYGFWRMQNINKKLILDLHQKTISIIPKFFLQRWLVSNVLKIDTTFSFNNLPEIKLLYYSNLKYHWTQRIYYKHGIWTIYLLEFEKKETAEKVMYLLKN
mgnify:FL=1